MPDGDVMYQNKIFWRDQKNVFIFQICKYQNLSVFELLISPWNEFSFQSNEVK